MTKTRNSMSRRAGKKSLILFQRIPASVCILEHSVGFSLILKSVLFSLPLRRLLLLGVLFGRLVHELIDERVRPQQNRNDDGRVDEDHQQIHKILAGT